VTSLKYVGSLFLLGGSLAYASSPAPIPTSYLGLDYLSTSTYSSGSTCVTVDNIQCGGEFTGKLGTGGLSNINPIAINFWCVDSQEDFSFPQGGLAQVVPLTQITNNPDVSYSGVTNGTTGPVWTNQTLNLPTYGAITLNGSAMVRYEMAAYLVSQFPQFDTSVNGTGGDPSDPNSLKVDAIEGAIWDIMSNSTPTEPAFIDFPALLSAKPGQDDIDYWIYQASLTANYTSKAGKFAVISWVANSSGGLQNADGHNAQTFLVEVAPEPGFYGALVIGFAGLFFAVRRRSNA
jgi:hypothetical protein